MATKVLAGGITDKIRHIEKAEHLNLRYTRMKYPTKYSRDEYRLDVTENGDTRSLKISREVFEVLAAWGIPYGS